MMLYVCKYQELLDNPLQIFNIPVNNSNFPIILLLHERQVRAYHNRCPHAWVALDAVDQDIISGCGQYLQCSSHFAQFRMHDGRCIYGPCTGQSLLQLDVLVRDDHIYVQHKPD